MFDIDFNIKLAEGVSHDDVRKHFLPRKLIHDQRKQCEYTDDGDIDDDINGDNGFCLYESMFDVKKVDGIRVCGSSSLLNNGKLANFAINEKDCELLVQTSVLQEDGDFCQDGLWKINLHDLENTKKIIFSSDVSYCVVVVFEGSYPELKLSVHSLGESNCKECGTSILQRDICKVKYDENVEYYSESWSAYSNKIVISTCCPHGEDQKLQLDIFKLEHTDLRKHKLFTLNHLKTVYLITDYHHWGPGSILTFNLFGNKIILDGCALFFYVYDIESTAKEPWQRFQGLHPSITYDWKTNQELLFTTVYELSEIQIHKISDTFDSHGNKLCSIYQLIMKFSHSDLSIEFHMTPSVFRTCSDSQPTLYIGNYSEVQVYLPLKQKHIATLRGDFTWMKSSKCSEKEASFLSQNGSRSYILKVYNMDCHILDSLQCLSRMVLLHNFSMNAIKKMNISKKMMQNLGI